MVLTSHESGKVALFDADTGEEVLPNERAHTDVVTDLQLSTDRTSSRAARTRPLAYMMPTFQTETPLNSAALAPNMPYVRVLTFLYMLCSDETCLSPTTVH
jgi:translation initiation factor 3 subunit I